jgi:peptidoglycan hydrolase-like amidase
VRVWLATQDTLSIESSGEIVIECYRDGERAEIYYTSSVIHVLMVKGKISIEDDNSKLAIDLTSVVFRPRFPNVFLDYAGKRYRGFIECGPDPDDRNKTRVFNLIDIELYLQGVLPGEIGDRTESEFQAVKAQAIAARTYAIWRLSSRPFDTHLKNSIDDQLYLGAGAELPLLNRAVEETDRR